MKNRKLLVISLICLLTFALVACGGNVNEGTGDTGSNEVSESSLAAKEIIAKSSEAMADVNNYKATMDMDMEIIIEDDMIDSKLTAEMNAFINPLKIKMEMFVPGIGDMDTYIVQEGDYLVTYINAYGAWLKQTQPFSEELLSQYTQTQYSEIFNDSLKSARIVSEESVNGVVCWKIDVVIDASTMMKIMEKMQGDQSLTSGIPADLIASMSDVTATLWISKDDYHQIKVYMNMSETMKGIDMQGAEVKKMEITMTTFDFGKATDFTLPAGAKDAIEIQM